MAQWSGNKVNSNDINNGIEYRQIDRPTRQQLNAIVNNSLFASNIAENVANQLSSLGANDKVEFKGSNPNLLINSDFSINQRGQTSYSGTNIYSVDRWKLQSLGSFDVTTKTYSTSERFSAIRQPVEDFQKYKGKTITYSVCVKSIPNGSFGINVRDGVNTFLKENITVGLNTFTVTINENATQLIFDIQARSTGENSIQLEYAKVEIGSIATTFSPRPYAEEFALCQRYFRVLNNTVNSYRRVSIGYAPTAKTARFIIPFNQMRTVPTVPLNPIPSGFTIYSPNVPLEYVDAVPSVDSIMLNFKIPDNNSTTLTVNQPIVLYTNTTLNTDGRIFLDAEMY